REMAQDNKTIGRFELSDIPMAPRGVPQIEVSFDLDANGILHVAAKDLGTGKEQSIRITASSGLSKEDIEKMTRDAEMHAEEDHKRRELVDTRNNADAMIHATQKSLKDLGDKVDADTKSNVEKEIEKVKAAAAGDDIEALKSAVEALTTASHKLAELMYAQASQQGADAGHTEGGASGSAPKDDDVVDADFEEVKDDKK
ncbi:MAG: Hsp70 family protein, partial [Desulfocapsaceae bacterium]|nr:Hsp70 family protein [Desulfocapsaceae bacterium]